MISPKPLSMPSHPYNGPRRPNRGKLMTLAAAFRDAKGGILLCADREWNDAGISKKDIDKLFEIRQLPDCNFFVAGSGPDAPIFRAVDDMRRALFEAAYRGRNVLDEYRSVLESVLVAIHEQFYSLLSDFPMSLLIVAMPLTPGKAPFLYRTEGAALIPEPFYFAVGSGRTITDYFANQLYDFERSDKKSLVTLAAFILREAASTAPGVGLRANMVYIYNTGKKFHYMPPEFVKIIQDGIPTLSETIESHWRDRLKLPGWFDD